CQSLRGMLARRPAPEVRIHNQNRSAFVPVVIERMAGVSRPVVFEQMVLEAFKRDRSQEPRRHDPIGIEIVAAEGESSSGDEGDGGHYACPSSSICRTSTTSPATAAAATIAGLISSVRPVGLP